MKFNLEIDIYNTKELLDNSKFYIENIDSIIDSILMDNDLPNTRNSIRIKKVVDDLKFAKTCAEIYVQSEKSKNWQVPLDTKKSIIKFLKGFKSSDNKIEYSKSIDII